LLDSLLQESRIHIKILDIIFTAVWIGNAK